MWGLNSGLKSTWSREWKKGSVCITGTLVFGKLFSLELMWDECGQEMFLMAHVETLEWQVLSDPFRLIGVCCLLRRWPMRRPLKDTKVSCHHLSFSAITSASEAGGDSDVILFIFPHFALPIISQHHLHLHHCSFYLFRQYLVFKNISSRKPPWGWSGDKQKRGNSFFLWTSIRLFINRSVVWL